MSDESKGLDKEVSNLSKESTMSIGPVETGQTQISLDENIFDDAKRALAPSGGQAAGTLDGGTRFVSPHMVNIHQFYPEIDFSLDKGQVGEVVLTPKSTSRSDLGKSRSGIDLKDTVIEEEAEPEESEVESEVKDTPPLAMPERSATEFATESSISIDDQGRIRNHGDKKQRKYDSDDEEEGVFSTQVDEETLDAARARQQSGGLFYPETWGAITEGGWSLEQIISGKAHTHYKKALELAVQQDYHNAILSYNKALSLSPRNLEFYTGRGEAYLHLCDFQSAILNYKKACVLDPDNNHYYNRLAFIYYFQGQCLFDQKLFPEALESFSRAAEMRPEVVGYHMRSIACLAALHRHGECLALVNKRLEAEHDNPDLYVMRARLHQLFRNTTLCYYDIKDALSLDPDHAEALSLMDELERKALDYRKQANNLNLMGRHKDGLEKISIAIETNPSMADFHVLRGALHRRLGDYNAAIDDYLLALDKTDHNEEHPTYQESQRQLLLTYNDFAVECFTKGFFEEAIILLNKAIKGEKREKGLYVNRGDCFYKDGNLQFALADYHQALELDEKDSLIRGRIAMIHNEYGVKEYTDKKYREADSQFTLAIQNNPRNAKYYISRARARHLMENLALCRQDILMALHLEPSNPEVPSLLARFFQGKSVKEILASKMADASRRQLQHLVMTAYPIKLKPLQQESTLTSTVSPSMKETLRTSPGTTEYDDDEDYTTEYDSGVEEAEILPPIAGSLWKPGGCFPSLKSCMQEQEFNIKIAEEKKEVNHRVKDALRHRRPLSYKGARVAAMPDPSHQAGKGGVSGGNKFAVKPPLGNKPGSTGWRTFSLGMSGGGSA